MQQNRGNRELNSRPFYLDRFEVRNNAEGRDGREKATGQRQTNPRSPQTPHKNVRPAAKKAPLKGWLNLGTPDVTFIFIVLILLLIGLVMMFSASYTYAYYDQKTGHDALFYIKRQGFFALLGVGLMFGVSFINYKKFNGFIAIFGYAASAFLLVVTLLVNIRKDSDFKRWLSIGPIRFQPSEIAKFALILMLAYITARQYGVITSKGKMHDGFWSDIDARFTSKIRASFYRNASTQSFALTLLYTMTVAFYCCLILLENHLSCTILMFMIGVSMMWLSGVKKGYFVLLTLFVGLAVAVVIMYPKVLPGYAGERIIAWKDKAYDPLGARWQTNQSLRAIASGGPFGLGLGNSRQKHMYVSEPQNDFIFAIVCEELGFVGAGAIVCLFGALVWRAFRIAKKSDDVFGAMLAMGIALQVGLQVFLNIAVVTDTFPNTGISLPFFSYGGTSLCMLLCEMGVILSVSKQNSYVKTKEV
ncbi:MAG: FtsW/RodA/SpoVE family cell cycle protein [Acutalibacteraceae bacterium]